MNLNSLIYTLLCIFMISGCDNHKSITIGYIEDEYIYLSTETTSKIKHINTNKGGRVKKGDILFNIDSYTLEKKSEILNKNKNYEKAMLHNMEKGIRKSEVDIINLDIDRLEKEIVKAESTLERKGKLKEKGFISKEDIEIEELNLALKRNNLKRLKYELINKPLPARVDELIAQKAKIEKIDIDIENNKYEISKTHIKSPTDGIISDILRREGEFVTPSNPVIIIVPNEGKKVKFYLNRKQLYNIKVSDSIRVKVSDVSKIFIAEVVYISPKPEYTPPMLYDDKNDTLVYLIEAKFKDKGLNLPAGIPVGIELK